MVLPPPALICLCVWGAFLERPTEPAETTRDRDFFISTSTPTWQISVSPPFPPHVW
jgi:hypothetical protein